VCDFVGALARSRRVVCSCLAFCVVVVALLFSVPFGMIPACSFYNLKEVQGYKMCDMWCDPCWRRSLEASGGPYPVATWSALWRHGVDTSSVVATCPGMCATVRGVVFCLLVL
jgi:hypothetical protein